MCTFKLPMSVSGVAQGLVKMLVVLHMACKPDIVLATLVQGSLLVAACAP